MYLSIFLLSIPGFESLQTAFFTVLKWKPNVEQACRGSQVIPPTQKLFGYFVGHCTLQRIDPPFV
jgi:hypothetical protein